MHYNYDYEQEMEWQKGYDQEQEKNRSNQLYQLSRKYKQCGERFRVKCFAISHTNDVH